MTQSHRHFKPIWDKTRAGFITLLTGLVLATLPSHAGAISMVMPLNVSKPQINANPLLSIKANMNTSSQPANTARDGNIAVREEFDAALAVGTVKAWELFILRHPEHPLADLAKEHLNALNAPKN